MTKILNCASKESGTVHLIGGRKMRFIETWVVMAVAIVLLFIGYGEPSWPVGFARATWALFSGVASALLLYFVLHVTNLTCANTNKDVVKNTAHTTFGSEAFICALAISAMALLIFIMTTALMLAIIIIGTITEHPGTVVNVIMFSPFAFLFLPMSIKRGMWK